MPYRYWTDKELDLLKIWQSNPCIESIREIASKTGRTIKAIREKIADMDFRPGKGISRKVKIPTADEILKERTEIERQRILTKREKEAAKKAISQRARTEMIVDLLRDVVQALPEVEVGKPRKRSRAVVREEEACLMVSDLELGEIVTKEETGGLGEYNFDIFLRRARNFKHAVEKILRIHQAAYPIRHLNVFLLGDIVHGLRHAGAWSCADLEFDVVHQLFRGVDAIAEMILYWIPLLEKSDGKPSIRVECVPGNHGRGARKGEEKHYVNWDFILYCFLAERLKANTLVEINPTMAWFRDIRVMNSNILLLHGEDTRGWMGLPYYGLVRDAGRYESMMKKFFDAICVAHWHQKAEIPTNSAEILVNGAWVGGSAYSLKQLKATSQPCQTMFGVCDKGITWRYSINLDRKTCSMGKKGRRSSRRRTGVAA